MDSCKITVLMRKNKEKCITLEKLRGRENRGSGQGGKRGIRGVGRGGRGKLLRHSLGALVAEGWRAARRSAARDPLGHRDARYYTIRT